MQQHLWTAAQKEERERMKNGKKELSPDAAVRNNAARKPINSSFMSAKVVQKFF